MPQPIQADASHLGLASRFFVSTTVAASPTAATETTIATLTVAGDLSFQTGVILFGWAAFTVGTSGVSARLRIRQTNTSGTTVGDTGATTGGIAATNLVILDCGGADTSPAAGSQVYVLTLTVGSGAAASTVSAVQLVAIAV